MFKLLMSHNATASVKSKSLQCFDRICHKRQSLTRIDAQESKHISTHFNLLIHKFSLTHITVSKLFNTHTKNKINKLVPYGTDSRLLLTDTETRKKIKNPAPTTFRYCALI